MKSGKAKDYQEMKRGAKNSFKDLVEEKNTIVASSLPFKIIPLFIQLCLIAIYGHLTFSDK
jgi:hypothetical protein